MNTFSLTEEQKNSICKRMPRGFTLIKPEELTKLSTKKEISPIFLQPQTTKIEHKDPVEIFTEPEPNLQFSKSFNIEPKLDVINSLTPALSLKQQQSEQQSDSLQLVSSASMSSVMPPPSLALARESSIFSSQASRPTSISKSTPVYNLDSSKHKSSQRLRIIVQKFKKHRKFSQLTNALSKMGQVVTLSRIEQQIKRNFHNLDTFKQKVSELLSQMKEQPQFAQLSQEFQIFLNQLILIGRQQEFEVNLQDIQKSVDRITRQLTDIKEQGQWYVRKKKRSDRPVDNKQLIYICDLVKTLPRAYLMGVWQIVHEKPFREHNDLKNIDIDFLHLKPRKIRQVEFYVKKKLQNMRKSRQSKNLKREKREALNKLREEMSKPQEQRKQIEQPEDKTQQKEQPEQPKPVEKLQMQLEQQDPFNQNNDPMDGQFQNNLEQPFNQEAMQPPEPNEPQQPKFDREALLKMKFDPEDDPLWQASSDSSIITDDEDSVD